MIINSEFFLTAIEEGVITTPEMAAWFVSKIPVTPGSVLFPGLFDVWLTADVSNVLQFYMILLVFS